ncbi:hypothetical protein evm_000462 [Chilo suppressalis]|nr:hypothetical protein evm_000409 [Chilo suppressalis]RVE55095.1 hypothetical protein evm_000462 [Chilo suppressalis]
MLPSLTEFFYGLLSRSCFCLIGAFVRHIPEQPREHQFCANTQPAKMSQQFLLFLFALAVAVSCSLAAPSDVEKRSVLYPYYYRYPYDATYYYDAAAGGYDASVYPYAYIY